MGAIYALFAALFYWIGKITGFQFYEKWGVIHFYLFTIAVNIVFFPMALLVQTLLTIVAAIILIAWNVLLGV